MRKVLIIDTSILCVWLKVPGMDNCGPDNDKWDKNRVNTKIEDENRACTTFILPLATIIETGNHISQASGDRYNCANGLADIIRKSVNEESPWAAFSAQSDLWSNENLISLADTWPNLACQKISLGDATILDVAEFYAQIPYNVEILTGDAGLKTYEPRTPCVNIPRRRKKRT